MKSLSKVLAIVVVLGLVFAFTPTTAVRADTLDVCPSGCTYTSIQAAINAATAGDVIQVVAGTYDEDVNLNKSLSLVGAGAGSTTIRGVIGGDGATIRISTSNVTVEGFTITRNGNNLTDWNNTGLNFAGIAIQGTTISGTVIQNNTFSGNRTAVDINNSSGHTIQNNVITDNRTGMLFRNQTDNMIVTNNQITNNWTMGILFIDASSGTNVPVQTALNSIFSENNLSGNWYGQVVDRQIGGSLPTPGTTNLKNFVNNWWGTSVPVVATSDSGEPGYPDLIPVAYGGTAVAPGGKPDILGPASANITYVPFYVDEAKTILNTDAVSTVYVDDDYNSTNTAPHIWGYDAFASIQQGIDAVADSGTIYVADGTYAEQLLIEKALNLVGPNAGISPNTGTRLAEAVITYPAGLTSDQDLVTGNADDISIDGFTLDGKDLDGAYLGNGIMSDDSNLTVMNNIVKNFTMVGIWTSSYEFTTFWDYSYYNSGLLIENNLLFSDLAGRNFDYMGIYVQGDNGVVRGNVVDDAYRGIQIQPYNNTNATQGLVEGNTVKAYRTPIWFNYSENAAVNWLIKSNTVEGIPYPSYETPDAWDGLLVQTFYAGNVAFTDNTVNIGTTDGTSVYMFRKINYTGGIVDMDATFANNTFQKVVVRTDGTNIIGDAFYSTIQGAIDAAAAGETILVGPGTYNEAVLLNKAGITVKATDGAATTIIDVPFGTLTTGVKTFANMGTITFDGFTVKNFTEGGIIQPMSAATGTTFDVLNNIVIPKADYLRNGIQVSGNGSTVKGNYVEGAYLTPSWGSTGILVVNASNVVVENNEVSGDAIGLDMGIGILNYSVASMDNILVKGNNIHNVDYSLDVTASSGTITGVVIEYNQITGYIEPIWSGTSGSGVSVSQVDASPNWWGSKFGPQGLVTGDVVTIKWCGDDTCTWFLPDDNNVIELTGAEVGGNAIYVPNLTILLTDGTVITGAAGKSCLDINASYTTVTTKSIGGAKCVPGAGANGINVGSALVNVIIEGIEFTGTTAADGVNFAGSIRDILVVNNWFHDLGGDGVEFLTEPQGVVSIQGNLFQNNAGNGIMTPGTFPVPAEWNSWGHVDGAAAGDGASAGVVTDPYTHVDLYIPGGLLPTGGQVTITVYGNLKNVMGAEFTLSYPIDVFTLVGTPTNLSGFVAAGPNMFDLSTGTIRFNGVVNVEDAVALSGVNLPIFSATFNITGGGTLDLLELDDLFSMFPNDAGPSTNIYAAKLVDSYVTANSWTVTGTVSMQGRSVRNGVPATLTGLHYGPYNATSTNIISNNLVFTGVAEGEYIFTTLQPRYLNVPASMAKNVNVIIDRTLPSLVLKGGNAKWTDNLINSQDAAVVGGKYKIGDIYDDADVNFDNKVDILDLTLVGGNYRLTSELAYATWIIP